MICCVNITAIFPPLLRTHFNCKAKATWYIYGRSIQKNADANEIAACFASEDNDFGAESKTTSRSSIMINAKRMNVKRGRRISYAGRYSLRYSRRASEPSGRASGRDTGLSVSSSSASDTSPSRVHQRQCSTGRPTSALGGLERSVDALSERTVDTCILAFGTARGGGKGGKLRIQLLCSLSVRQSE